MERAKWVTVPIALLCIFGGCCLNVISLEYIIKSDKSCGALVTFAQFLFISVEGLRERFSWHKGAWHWKSTAIPITCYVIMVSMFWLSSMLNNWVFFYNVSLPIHSVFRSSSMVMNVITAYVIYQRVPSLAKLVTILVMTGGVILLAIVSIPPEKLESGGEQGSARLEWFTGIFLLFLGQFLSSLLGLYQETTYRKHGKAHSKESMFFTHFLSMPLFLLSAPEILETVSRWNSVELDGVTIGGMMISYNWLYLLCNMISQWVCIRGVYLLISHTNSLTLTVALALRKFVSLIISIIYFRNPFTVLHWVGSVVVIGAALVFSYHEAFAQKAKTP